MKPGLSVKAIAGPFRKPPGPVRMTESSRSKAAAASGRCMAAADIASRIVAHTVLMATN